MFDLCWDKYCHWHTEALASFIRKLNTLVVGSYFCPELDALREISAREVLKNLCRRPDSKQLQLVLELVPRPTERAKKDCEALTNTEKRLCSVFAHVPAM